MKWIGRGSLRIDHKRTLLYGDEIPEGVLSKEREKELRGLGKIGEIIERINEHPEVRALKAQIARRDEKIDSLKAELAELKKPADKKGKGDEK